MKPIETLNDVAAGLDALKALDPRLVAVIEQAGDVPLRRRAPTLASLMRIVVSQQVSVQSAAAIWDRFEQTFDLECLQTLVAADEDALRAVGLSRPKIKTLRALAMAAVTGSLDCTALVGLPRKEVNQRLTTIHGIGPWTSEIFSLFCLGDPDIFPVGDIALQQAVMDAFSLEERPKGEVLSKITAHWSPWQGVAARLFWAYYATNKGRASLPI